jgi:hypothetical protein
VRKGGHRWLAELRRQSRAAAWPSAGGGRQPGWAGVGPSALGPKANGAGFGGRQRKKNGGGPHKGMGQNQRIKKNVMFKWFRIYLGFKNQRSQNIFKLKFELGYTKINLNKLFGDFSNLELLEIDLNN